MSSNGSPEPSFDFDDARTWFQVVLPIHPSFLATATKPPPRDESGQWVVAVSTAPTSLVEAVRAEAVHQGLTHLPLVDVHHPLLAVTYESLEAVVRRARQQLPPSGVATIHLFLRCPLALAGALVASLSRDFTLILYQHDAGRYHPVAKLDRSFHHRVEAR